ncbi:hypothetical protein ATERTT37_003252 [Aspergillus terreus]
MCMCVRSVFLEENDGLRLIVQCASLSSSEVGDKVIYPGDAAYETSVHSYWAVNVQLEPACIVQPHSADDVAAVVQILTSAGGDSPCKFAVRSGGHMTWAGSNNIETGVTIDLQMMNSTIYNEEAKVASILPGARWESVYKTLEEYNVVVPGGRTGPVGVGGFLLGGGNSFHAARVGLACDNIINYEVVLASGRIVNANIESNTDLFKALKGGGNNFGIVTNDVFLTSTYLNSAKVLQKTIDILNEKILKAKPVAQGKDWSIMVIIQPWPKIFWQRTQSNGVGNVLGLDRFDDNMLQVLYDYSWDSEADDALFQCLCEEAMAELDDYAKSIGKYNEYIYLNYADKTQNPLRGYGDENVEYIRAVAQRYDPDGVFQTQVPGGFKVSQAEEMILHLVAKNKLGDTSIAREAQDLARPVVLGAILTTYG